MPNRLVLRSIVKTIQRNFEPKTWERRSSHEPSLLRTYISERKEGLFWDSRPFQKKLGITLHWELPKGKGKDKDTNRRNRTVGRIDGPFHLQGAQSPFIQVASRQGLEGIKTGREIQDRMWRAALRPDVSFMTGRGGLHDRAWRASRQGLEGIKRVPGGLVQTSRVPADISGAFVWNTRTRLINFSAKRYLLKEPCYRKKTVNQVAESVVRRMNNFSRMIHLRIRPIRTFGLKIGKNGIGTIHIMNSFLRGSVIIACRTISAKGNCLFGNYLPADRRPSVGLFAQMDLQVTICCDWKTESETRPHIELTFKRHRAHGAKDRLARPSGSSQFPVWFLTRIEKRLAVRRERQRGCLHCRPHRLTMSSICRPTQKLLQSRQLAD
ncbi:unnamed protein product [Nesidiocoris tenuis]|uniref:Uncharacterized protein n=1 Tax=Nesidiocoris tenuis TaxID=355587 RepID=A0A6H5HTR2_9HEMI|nr:unnamed protein product [Nesidiocoris tenuis]